MPLRETPTLRVAYEWEMAPMRRSRAKCAVDEQLSRRRAQEIFAAHHFGDRHRDVVGDDGELVCRHVVFAPHDEVSEVDARGERLLAAADVGETNYFAVWYAKTPHDAGGTFDVAPCVEWRTQLGRKDRLRAFFVLVRRVRRVAHLASRDSGRIDVASVAQLAPHVFVHSTTARL